MLKIVLLVLLHIDHSFAVTHSLKYFYTATSGIPGFPEFVSVGMLDGEPFSYYNSSISREISRQEWAKEKMDPDYWNRNTQALKGTQQIFKGDIQILKQRFNQTAGIHTFQKMYGCEWDDETGSTEGYSQYGYDGEDLISLDLKNKKWIAPVQEAHQTKLKWDSNTALIERQEVYFTKECIEWLKKYVGHGRSALQRKVPPEVTLLQKNSSSPVTCLATGFYPREISVSWQRDGEDLHEDVELEETLPNGDGTFQIRISLRVSTENMKTHNYTCTVQHSSLKEKVVKILREDDIKRNKGADMKYVLIIGVLLAILLTVIAAVGVIILFKKRKTDRQDRAEKSQSVSSSSSNDSETPQKKTLPDDMDLAGQNLRTSSWSSVSSGSSCDSETPLMKQEKANSE